MADAVTAVYLSPANHTKKEQQCSNMAESAVMLITDWSSLTEIWQGKRVLSYQWLVHLFNTSIGYWVNHRKGIWEPIEVRLMTSSKVSEVSYVTLKCGYFERMLTPKIFNFSNIAKWGQIRRFSISRPDEELGRNGDRIGDYKKSIPRGPRVCLHQNF